MTGNGSSKTGLRHSLTWNNTSILAMRSAAVFLPRATNSRWPLRRIFNLVPRNNPEDPIRRQMIPRIVETWTSPYDMADPCGEDSHMPVPGLVHRYPDRVLFLVTDRCASYCRYCTRSRVVSGVGEQELHTNFEEAFRLSRTTHGSPRRAVERRRRPHFQRRQARKHACAAARRSRTSSFSASARASRFSCRNASRLSYARCSQNYHPLWMSVHVNHPRELTIEVKRRARASRATPAFRSATKACFSLA